MAKKTNRNILFAMSIFLLAMVGTPLAARAQEVNDVNLVDELNLHGEPRMPGRVEGTGTYFEVNDSNYLSITLESSEPVHLILESVPEMVVIHLEAAEGATSAQITLGGFLPSTTYYKYEDNYHNEVAFTTDENGSYTYMQALSEQHLVFIQPRAGTRFIPTDTEIGIWDPVSRTYTLTTDVYETIQIDEDNLTLDGGGYTVTGPGWYCGYGVYLSERTGVTIKDVNVQRFFVGIYLWYSSGNTLTTNTASDNHIGIDLSRSHNNTLTGNTANSNNYSGIRLVYSSNGNTLTGNTANSNNYYGIYLWTSNGNTLTANTASNNYYGINLFRSSNSTLTGNAMLNNLYNFFLWGDSDSHFDNDIDSSNTVDGKAIYYVKDAAGEIYDSSTAGDAGTLYFIDCNDITIRDLTLTNNGAGVFLWKTDNSRIENVTASDNRLGVYLYSSSSNTLESNTSSNNECGIYLRNSSNNTLTGNTASNNIKYGHYGYGYGIYLWNSNSNQIYNNNFIENETQACVYSGGRNVFNLDKPIGGNYWSDWTSPDSNGDGFVDSPYVIPGWGWGWPGGQDNLPWTRQDGWLVGPPTWLDGSTLTASDIGLTSLVLTWTPAVHDVGVTEYLIFKDGTLIGTIPGTETTCQVTGLESDTQYTFKVEACDGEGNCSTNGPSVTVRTLTPVGATKGLINQVVVLNLQQGIENSLDAKLDAALQALEDINQNNDVAAINTLQAFINAVEAQRGNKIPEADADALIADVLEIINLLSAE